MGDPLQPVQPGMHSPLVRNGRTINAVLDAARAYQRTRRPSGSHGFQNPSPWGVDYYTDPANSAAAGYDQRWALWEGRFPFGNGSTLYSYYSWETTVIKSELIIPPNTGWVWVSGGIYAQHGPGTWVDESGLGVSIVGAGATNFSYTVVARAAIRDLDDMTSSMSGRITDWKKFAAGQVYAVEGASSETDPTFIMTGNYDPQENGYSSFHGEADFGMLLFVGSAAKRLAFVVGFYIQNAYPPATIGGLQYAFRVPHGYTGSDADVLNKGRCWLTYQPVDFTTTTPDATALEVTATEDPDNGTHAATHTVAFDSTVTGGVSAFTYSWDFGDGGTSIAADPSHDFAYTGTYRPLVTVRDSIGQSATAKLNAITITGGSPPPPPPPPPPPTGCRACSLVGETATLVFGSATVTATWLTDGSDGAYVTFDMTGVSGWVGSSTIVVTCYGTDPFNPGSTLPGRVFAYMNSTNYEAASIDCGPPAVFSWDFGMTVTT